MPEDTYQVTMNLSGGFAPRAVELVVNRTEGEGCDEIHGTYVNMNWFWPMYRNWFRLDQRGDDMNAHLLPECVCLGPKGVVAVCAQICPDLTYMPLYRVSIGQDEMWVRSETYCSGGQMDFPFPQYPVCVTIDGFNPQHLALEMPPGELSIIYPPIGESIAVTLGIKVEDNYPECGWTGGLFSSPGYINRLIYFDEAEKFGFLVGTFVVPVGAGLNLPEWAIYEGPATLSQICNGESFALDLVQAPMLESQISSVPSRVYIEPYA
jgi:hypothetical protein